MIKSHATGWASDSPTPAQMKELFAQIDSGRVTKTRFQGFLRNDEQPVVEVKGRAAFQAFLDKELGSFGFSHWYEGDEIGGDHYIGVPKYRNWLLKQLIGRADPKIAQITAEPDPDSYAEVESDAFRIRILNAEMRPKLQQVAEAFRNAGFGLPVEIID
ncbi:MAG: hypothetical protein Q7J73_02460 [Dehalococcoidales bacterium]|nr:hypothetical protein [Dehalococcoidales bacterium]